VEAPFECGQLFTKKNWSVPLFSLSNDSASVPGSDDLKISIGHVNIGKLSNFNIVCVVRQNDLPAVAWDNLFIVSNLDAELWIQLRTDGAVCD
jgi:hypothetical protein